MARWTVKRVLLTFRRGLRIADVQLLSDYFLPNWQPRLHSGKMLPICSFYRYVHGWVRDIKAISILSDLFKSLRLFFNSDSNWRRHVSSSGPQRIGGSWKCWFMCPFWRWTIAPFKHVQKAFVNSAVRRVEVVRVAHGFHPYTEACVSHKKVATIFSFEEGGCSTSLSVADTWTSLMVTSCGSMLSSLILVPYRFACTSVKDASNRGKAIQKVMTANCHLLWHFLNAESS